MWHIALKIKKISEKIETWEAPRFFSRVFYSFKHSREIINTFGINRHMSQLGFLVHFLECYHVWLGYMYVIVMSYLNAIHDSQRYPQKPLFDQIWIMYELCVSIWNLESWL